MWDNRKASMVWVMQMDREKLTPSPAGEVLPCPVSRINPSLVCCSTSFPPKRRGQATVRDCCVHVSGSPTQPGKRKPRFSFLLYLSPPCAGKPVIFSGKPLDGEEMFKGRGRKDCNRSTKTTKIWQLANFSCMTCGQTAIKSWLMSLSYILEVLWEAAFQAGLLRSSWLKAPPSTAHTPMMTCCHLPEHTAKQQPCANPRNKVLERQSRDEISSELFMHTAGFDSLQGQQEGPTLREQFPRILASQIFIP